MSRQGKVLLEGSARATGRRARSRRVHQKENARGAGWPGFTSSARIRRGCQTRSLTAKAPRHPRMPPDTKRPSGSDASVNGARVPVRIRHSDDRPGHYRDRSSGRFRSGASPVLNWLNPNIGVQHASPDFIAGIPNALIAPNFRFPLRHNLFEFYALLDVQKNIHYFLTWS